MFRKVNSFDVGFESLPKYAVNMCNRTSLTLRQRDTCDNLGHY